MNKEKRNEETTRQCKIITLLFKLSSNFLINIYLQGHSEQKKKKQKKEKKKLIAQSTITKSTPELFKGGLSQIILFWISKIIKKKQNLVLFCCLVLIKTHRAWRALCTAFSPPGKHRETILICPVSIFWVTNFIHVTQPTSSFSRWINK